MKSGAAGFFLYENEELYGKIIRLSFDSLFVSRTILKGNI